MSRYAYDHDTKALIPITGANHVNVDSRLSLTSENPVQNKVIAEALSHPSIPIDPTSAEISGFPNGAMWLVTS